MPLSFRIIFFGLFIFLLASCSVQQRRYRSGLTLSWHHSNRFKETESAHVGEIGKPKEQVPEEVTALTDHSLSTTTPADRFPGSTDNFRQLKQSGGDSCDVIVFRDGRRIQAMLLNVGTEELRYRRCDNPEGPVFVIHTRDVQMIKYANGQTKYFTENKNPVQQNYRNPSIAKERHPLALPSLILAILGIPLTVVGFGIILFIISFFMANKVIRDDIASPGVYSGVNAAKAAKAIDTLVFIIMVFLLVVAIYVILGTV